jgi:hypothetical protein
MVQTAWKESGSNIPVIYRFIAQGTSPIPLPCNNSHTASAVFGIVMQHSRMYRGAACVQNATDVIEVRSRVVRTRISTAIVAPETQDFFRP